MSHIISVTPEQLKSQAQVYIQAKEGIAEQNRRVKSMNDQIAQQWKGQAFQAYLQQYEQLSGHVQKFEELLADINRQLNQYAQTIAERDQQDAKSFGLN